MHPQKKEILKQFTIGFLPLLIYILVEDLVGFMAAVTLAVVFAAVQLMVIFFREKKWDFFTLLDLGILVLLSGISLAFHSDRMIKLKPAFMNLLFIGMIGVTVYSSRPLLIEMLRRNLRGIPLEEDQVKEMKRMMKGVLVLLVFHTGLIIYAAYYLSSEAWGFISGGLFYLLFVFMIILELARKKWNQIRLERKYADDEWFPLVNPEGKIIGKVPRTLVHDNPSLLHPVIHLHVLNRRGEIYLQRRAEHKEIQPGKWDTAVGGHVRFGETVEEALRREAEEELGVDHLNVEFLLRYVWRTEWESELVYVFRSIAEGPFRHPAEEIAEGRFWRRSEIEKNIPRQLFTPNFLFEYGMLRQMKIF